MIKAINKYGRVAYFSERVWEMMQKPNRNGWVIYSEKDAANIPDVVVEFQAKKKQEVVAVKKEKTVDEMKQWLKEKNIKFHHKLSDEKIKSLYDESQK